MTKTKRSSVLALLFTGGTLASAVATAEPQKVGAAPATPVQAPAPSKITVKSIGAPGALTTDQRTAVGKAMQTAVAAYAKDKNASKAIASRQGLTGAAAKSYRTRMTAFLGANTVLTASSRYSIEDGLVSIDGPTHSGVGCTATVRIDLVFQNKIGGQFPTDKPAPSLELWPLLGSGGLALAPAATAPLPRLAPKQSQTVRVTMSAATTWDAVQNRCYPVIATYELNLVGVASMGVYTLTIGDGGFNLEAFPLGTTPAAPGGDDFPGGFPDACTGMLRCSDGTCVPLTLTCGAR